MLRLVIAIFLIVGVSLLYLFMDRSKEAAVERERKRKARNAFLHEKVVYPFNEAVMTRIPEEKIRKTESQYRQAGYTIPYTVTLLINGAGCVGSFMVATFVLNNIFLGFVGLAMGWIIPTTIIRFLINRRIKRLDHQLGIFMRMVTERYKSTNSFYRAFQSTTEEFAGEEPIYSELAKTAYAVSTGEPMSEALMDLGHRTSNKYMLQFADYYTQTSMIGTEEAMDRVLTMAVEQYERHIENDRNNARAISEISMQSYMMLGMVPLVALFGIFEVDDYIPFMTTTLMGKIGTAVIVLVWMLVFWVVTFKLSAPLDE